MNDRGRPEAAHGSGAKNDTAHSGPEPEPRLLNAKYHVLPRVEDDRRRRALEPRHRWRAYARRFADAGVIR